MQTWSSREELAQQVVTLRRKGMSRNAIARALDVSPNTVGKILRTHDAAREEPHTVLTQKPVRAPRPTKLDSYLLKIAGLLDHYDDITAQRLYEEIKAAGYSGGYTAVKDYVRKARPPKKPKPSLEVPPSGPGELAESDWTPHVLHFTNGQVLKVQFFDFALRYSTRKTFFAYEHSDHHALMEGHVKTFERFGGAAAKCKYDSQKPVVLHWEGDQPIYNPRFLAFAAYYEFKPVACRRAAPNEKPRAERSFWELEQSFLNGREFRDLEDLRAQLAHWLDTICDGRPHKKLKRPRMEMFAEEKQHLIPLPRHPYDTARVVYRLCNLEGFIAWDGNRYAVDYDHVTDFLPIRITQDEIFIYAADLEIIARYQLAQKGAHQDVDPLGLHRRAAHHPAADLDQLQKTFSQVGEVGAEFFLALKAHQGRQAGHQARQILLLRDRYSTADLAVALRHAQQFGAFDHRAVGRILQVHAKPRRLQEYTAESVVQRFGEAIRGASTGPRDLDEYDRIFTLPPPEEETK